MTPYLELMRTLKSHQIHGSFLLLLFFFFFFFFFFCFQVGLFGPVNPLGLCQAGQVLLLDRFIPPSSQPIFAHILSPETDNLHS